jgi:hypothetical protein
MHQASFYRLYFREIYNLNDQFVAVKPHLLSAISFIPKMLLRHPLCPLSSKLTRMSTKGIVREVKELGVGLGV